MPAYSQLICSIQDPCLRAIACGRSGALLQRFERTFARQGIAPVMLGLAAFVSDHRRQASSCTQDQRPHSASALAALERATAEALPLVADRLQSRSPDIRRHAALLMAEAVGPGEATLPGLVELLSCPDDRTRYRAALALHGSRSGADPGVPTSVFGTTGLGLLAREWLARRDHKLQIAKVLEWTFEHLRHDDPLVLTNWIEAMKRGPGERRIAEVILSRIHRVDSDAWSVFVEGLGSTSVVVRHCLLLSICWLLARDRLDDEHWQMAIPLLVSPAAGDDEPVLLAGPEALADVVEEVAEWPGTDAPVAACERGLASRQLSLGKLLAGDPAHLRSRLAAAGGIRLASRVNNRQYLLAGERVAGEPQVFSLLIDWLEQRLQNDVQDLQPFVTVNADLLAVAAAAAERLPDAMHARIADSPLLECLLAEAAECHNTFTGRHAAFHLLSHGGRVTRRVATVLATGIRDVTAVQSAVLASLYRYQRIESEALGATVQLLQHDSSATAFAAGRLLAGLARYGRISRESRWEIVGALAAAAGNPDNRRPVFLLAKQEIAPNDCVFRIQQRGRLDALLRDSLTEVTAIGIGIPVGCEGGADA